MLSPPNLAATSVSLLALYLYTDETTGSSASEPHGKPHGRILNLCFESQRICPSNALLGWSIVKVYYSILYPAFETCTVALHLKTNKRHNIHEPSGNITRPSSDPARSNSAPGDLREQFAVAESMHVWLSTRPRTRPRSLYRLCSSPRRPSRRARLRSPCTGYTARWRSRPPPPPRAAYWGASASTAPPTPFSTSSLCRARHGPPPTPSAVRWWATNDAICPSSTDAATAVRDEEVTAR